MRLPRVFAAAAVVAASLTVVGAFAPATAAHTRSAPQYVGIVISADKTACVPWRSGITGDDVLNAVARVHYRVPDGIIDQVDGKPSPAHTDDTHYWSYWHNTGSGWSYSNLGASAYTPQAGTVEGWNFINGSSQKSAPSGTGSYASVCGSVDSSPAPRKPSTHHPVSRRTGHSPRAVTAPPAGQRAPAGRVSSSAAPSSRPASSSGGAPGAPGAAGVTSAAACPSAARASVAPSTCLPRITGQPASRTAASGVVVVSGKPVADERRASSGSAWPTVFAIALAVALAGGGGVVAVLRRRAARG